MVLKLCTTSFQ